MKENNELDWQYDQTDEVWVGFCHCGSQLWREEELPINLYEMEESILCLNCGKIGCTSCMKLTLNNEWLCLECTC